MSSSKFVLLVVLPLFARSIPVYSPRDAPYDSQQALFGAKVDDDGISPTSIEEGPSLQDVLDTPPPATTVWFSPEGSVPPRPSSGNTSSPQPIVAAYYPDWTASHLSPEMVNFDWLDWVDFAFAVPDPTTFTPKFLDEGSGDILDRLVTAAHTKNKSVKLSIGGWTGSAHFSEAVNDQNRKKFASDIVELYNQFNLDGIDMFDDSQSILIDSDKLPPSDWEYPGEAGAAGNIHSPSDSANFLTFLQLLRPLLPESARITAATQVWPFVDATGAHMKDISAFAKVLDWVLLMNYDVWNSSPDPGPNAPLSNACNNSTQPEANAHAAVASWTSAGFPADQIMLGLPAYGYVSKSSAVNLRSRRRSLANPSASAASEGLNATGDPIGNVVVTSESDSADSGQIQFHSLLTQGALVRNKPGASPAFTGAGGFERNWDPCSSTPFLRSSATQQIVSYDDPESLGMKAAFAKQAGILGVNMWDAHGDTQEWDLVDSIRKGLGVS